MSYLLRSNNSFSISKRSPDASPFLPLSQPVPFKAISRQRQAIKAAIVRENFSTLLIIKLQPKEAATKKLKTHRKDAEDAKV